MPTTSNNRGSLVFLAVICSVAALGGFLFGFDTGVVSGINASLKVQYQLTAPMEGWFVSSALLGCIFGAMAAGWLADLFGRKFVLILSGIFFFLSAAGCGYPPNFTLLVIARMLGGLGIGIASMVAPLYISEISPPKLRGRLVTLFQLAVVVGIFASYASNSLILTISEDYADWITSESLGFVLVRENWRGMFLAGTFPALLFLLLLLPIPESPRFWAKQGKEEKARAVLAKILGREEADREIVEIRAVLQQESGRILELFDRYRLGLLIAVLLMFFSQVTGINVIMYFGNQVFENAGFSKTFSFRLQTLVGVSNIVFTLFALWKVDTLGRRPLLKIGTACLLVILTVMSLLFAFQNSLPPTLMYVSLPVFIILFVAAFAMSWGPIPWVVVSEIFPTRIRGRAASIGTMTIWISCLLVAQTFPMLRENLGPAACFAVYAACMIPAMLFVGFVLPETKGRSLEELERILYENEKTEPLP